MHSQMLRLRGYDLLKSWEPHVRKREVRCIYVRWAIDAVLICTNKLGIVVNGSLALCGSLRQLRLNMRQLFRLAPTSLNAVWFL